MGNKLQTLRSLNADFARAYKYEFKIITAPKVTLPDGVISKLSSHCINVTSDSSGSTLIEAEVGVNTLKLHGRNERGGVLNPEFLLDGDYSIYKFFREWKNQGTPDIDSEVQAYSNDLLATVQIYSKDVANKTTMVEEYKNVWCRNCPEITRADDSNDVIRFSPELVYEFGHVVSS